MKRTVTIIVLCAALSAGSPLVRAAFASDSGNSPTSQEIKQGIVRDVTGVAAQHFQRGEQAYKSGQYDMARREFDEAVDAILTAPINIAADDELRAYYRELIEKINRYQIISMEQKDGGFSEQRYEPSPLDKLASLSDAELEEVAADDEEINARFNFNFEAAYPIKQFISYFTRGRGRATMEAGLARSVRYRAMAERIFKEEGVPTDLIWLAQVESGWNPYALSSAAAKGMWQFVPATGTRFGLQQNYWLDERANPEKSTRAAARYLKFLATRYHNDWALALASYNTGEGNVDAAIARAGTRDFWRLHRGGYLAQETRNYVPAILAVVTIAKSAKKYGFELPPAYPYRYETRWIAKQTDLRPLAKKLNISYGALLELNPELQRGSTPPGKHALRVPAASAPKTEAAEESTAVTSTPQ
ncbi:MAG TPA: lytic transglycosylase domain-containing protein [Blastocatellia bacterium]|nr:lytic transglycosylase domain-containing protein [Blastocatellia bacterium]